MSASLKLNTPGSGSVILTPASSIVSDVTVNVPSVNSTLIYSDASNNLQMNSGYGSVATAYGCRAWVNFNGKGTVAIRASANVSSITDSGTGNYLVNFTNSMPDANYSAIGNSRFEVTGGNVDFTAAIACADLAIGSVRVWTSDGAAPNTAEDEALISVAIFR